MEISINKQLDKQVYLDFYNYKIGGVDFGEKIRSDYPGLTIDNYDSYIDNFYSQNNFDVSEAINCFEEIKTVLFGELKQYFGRDYSQESYRCYLSMFNCNPRYIETKTFQVYYKKPPAYIKEVMAHELTHFVFYDYCHELGIQDSNELWELSEIFNVIFLNLDPVRAILGVEEKLFYPELAEKLLMIKRIWEKGMAVSEFINTSLELLRG